MVRINIPKAGLGGMNAPLRDAQADSEAKRAAAAAQEKQTENQQLMNAARGAGQVIGPMVEKAKADARAKAEAHADSEFATMKGEYEAALAKAGAGFEADGEVYALGAEATVDFAQSAFEEFSEGYTVGLNEEMGPRNPLAVQKFEQWKAARHGKDFKANFLDPAMKGHKEFEKGLLQAGANAAIEQLWEGDPTGVALERARIRNSSDLTQTEKDALIGTMESAQHSFIMAGLASPEGHLLAEDLVGMPPSHLAKTVGSSRVDDVLRASYTRLEDRLDEATGLAHAGRGGTGRTVGGSGGGVAIPDAVLEGFEAGGLNGATKVVTESAEDLVAASAALGREADLSEHHKAMKMLTEAGRVSAALLAGDSAALGKFQRGTQEFQLGRAEAWRTMGSLVEQDLRFALDHPEGSEERASLHIAAGQRLLNYWAAQGQHVDPHSVAWLAGLQPNTNPNHRGFMMHLNDVLATTTAAGQPTLRAVSKNVAKALSQYAKEQVGVAAALAGDPTDREAILAINRHASDDTTGDIANRLTELGDLSGLIRFLKSPDKAHALEMEVERLWADVMGDEELPKLGGISEQLELVAVEALKAGIDENPVSTQYDYPSNIDGVPGDDIKVKPDIEAWISGNRREIAARVLSSFMPGQTLDLKSAISVAANELRGRTAASKFRGGQLSEDPPEIHNPYAFQRFKLDAEFVREGGIDPATVVGYRRTTDSPEGYPRYTVQARDENGIIANVTWDRNHLDHGVRRRPGDLYHLTITPTLEHDLRMEATQYELENLTGWAEHVWMVKPNAEGTDAAGIFERHLTSHLVDAGGWVADRAVDAWDGLAAYTHDALNDPADILVPARGIAVGVDEKLGGTFTKTGEGLAALTRKLGQAIGMLPTAEVKLGGPVPPGLERQVYGGHYPSDGRMSASLPGLMAAFVAGDLDGFAKGEAEAFPEVVAALRDRKKANGGISTFNREEGRVMERGLHLYLDLLRGRESADPKMEANRQAEIRRTEATLGELYDAREFFKVHSVSEGRSSETATERLRMARAAKDYIKWLRERGRPVPDNSPDDFRAEVLRWIATEE